MTEDQWRERDRRFNRVIYFTLFCIVASFVCQVVGIWARANGR